ncbi:MAG: adenylosuccinate lyase [Phycisphaeraceae bacterium]|nr:MAG: adenylosuccinate lyase [Phycisphaeraceae bacterium]
MSSPHDTYTSPLAQRNASPEMLRLWSPRYKFNTWRRIWLAAARAQLELGLPVSREQVEHLRAVVERGITDEEILAAGRYERELRHDVMAHVHALGDACPAARAILHLGMTSQDVNDNAETIILERAMGLIAAKVARVVLALADRAERWKATPTLAFTHYQPAQPTTVGRRCAGWAYELWLSETALVRTRDMLKGRGLRGATGTQASYLALCDGDPARVDELERRFCDALAGQFAGEKPRVDAFGALHDLVGQTYPRVVDADVLAGLASIAAVLHKTATDIRLLCNRKELDEPFEDTQIGSSAMPYKRNPMRCERVCGLSRFVMNLVGNAYDTAATQWLERTLDDSSNRRLSLPEAFLALDGALDLMHNVASGLVVHEATVRANLMAELPFMATENILMECVKLGGDRQAYHEAIRVHAQAAGLRVKQQGQSNDLLERLRSDRAFWGHARGGPLSAELVWDHLLDPMKYIGRAVEQTERFLRAVVQPLRDGYAGQLQTLGDSSPRV